MKFLSSEKYLGALVALLSVFTAVASYQGAMADSEQNKHEILGMTALNDGNAEYLSGNQTWIQDDGNYDNWYINRDANPDLAEYYRGNFTQELEDAIARNGEDEYPMDDQYADAIYAYADEYWADADEYFDLGSQWDERGDQLQLVLLIMALGLALAAWGSLLGEESGMRKLYSLLATLTMLSGLVTYFVMVPAI